MFIPNYSSSMSISQILAYLAADKDVRLVFVKPSSPQRNVYVGLCQRAVSCESTDWLLFHLMN